MVMHHATFRAFVSALVHPEEREIIGLVISDEDAAALLGNREWAEQYHATWAAMPPLDRE